MRKRIEKVLRERGKALVKLDRMELAQRANSEIGEEKDRWRITDLSESGHGFAGGKYYRTLAEIADDWLL